MYATRGDPRLSPDSITYLSVAEHLRTGVGMSDFTRVPLTVFPPVYPLLLAPGGDSLLWVRLVGALSMALCCWLLFVLVEPRVSTPVAVVAVAGFGLSVGMVLVSSSTVSEPVYIALSLTMLVVLRRDPLTLWWCAVGGAVAGACFLTRYAGISSVITAVVVVAVVTRRWIPVLVTGTTAAVVATTWLARNAIATGTPLGPRFAGGLSESLRVILRSPLDSIGVGLGLEPSSTWALVVGGAVLCIVAAGAVVIARSPPVSATDLGMVVLAVTSFAVPVVARTRTASDVSPRVMSPMLACTFYFGAVLVQSGLRRAVGRSVAAVATVAVAWSSWQGLVYAAELPALASSGWRSLYSEQLYDEIDALPAETVVITNNPWGVWWQNRREPTLMAFTRPRVGNSHRPIEADELLELACTSPTTLAWFSTLQNAGDGPDERRPDLYEILLIEITVEVPGGALYRVTPLDPRGCPSVSDR